MKQVFTNRIFALGLILILCFLLRIPTLYTPIVDIDESQYGEFAIKLVHGKIPYLDAVGEKPPFLYYFFAAVFSLGGDYSYEMVHLATTLWVMLTIVFLFLFIQRIFGTQTGLLAALLYTVFHTAHEPAIISTNGETLMNLPMLMGIYFLGDVLQAKKSWRRWLGWVLVGLFFGFGFMFRQQAMFQMGSLALLLLFLWLKEVRWETFFQNTFIKIGEGWLLLLCFFLPIGVSIFGLHGVNPEAAQEYYFWNWDFNNRYVQSGADNIITIERTLIRLLPTLLFFSPLIVFSIWYGFAYGRKGLKSFIENPLNAQDAVLFFLIVNLFINSIVVCLGWRLWTHYFLYLLPSLVMIASIGLSRFLGRVHETGKGRWVWKATIISMIVLAMAGLLPRIHHDYTMHLLDQLLPNTSKYSGIFPEQKKIAQWISDHSNPEDTIFIWGFQTTINAYAKRENGSRLSWTDFMVGQIPGVSYETASQIDFWSYRVDKTWDYFWEDMQKYQPLFFIDTASAGYHYYDLFPIQNYSAEKKGSKRYDLWGFVQERYSLVHSIDNVQIYQRKSLAP